MKRYTLVVATFFALTLLMIQSSCSNDDDEDTSMSITEIRANLIGSWEELGYERDGEVFKEEITFESDGTFDYWYFHDWGDRKSLKGTWNLKDNKTITLISDSEAEDYYFSYEIDSYNSTISNIYISPLFRHHLYKE